MNKKTILALGISLVFVMGFSAALKPSKKEPSPQSVHKEKALIVTKEAGSKALS